MSKKNHSSAVKAQPRPETKSAHKPDSVVFMGVERPYDDVMEHYEMIRDAYFHYKSHECRRMTESKRSYVISFKQRVDELGAILGLNTEMTLPDNIDKISKKNTEEDE
jgi:hypothetical protein